MLILKIGGGGSISLPYIAQDVALLLKKEEFRDNMVIVHGANAIRDRVANDLGRPTRTITSPSGVSSVYTDAAAMEIFLMAYPGIANTRVVAALAKEGVPAVGLSGADGALWLAERKKALYAVENGKTKLITDSYTGRIIKINTELIRHLLSGGYIPVVCPPAVTIHGELVNVDNDAAVTRMAQALGAAKIVSLFEAPGFLADPKDPKSCIPRLNALKLRDMLSSASGRMKKKVLGALEALETGGAPVTLYWGDGRVPHPVTAALAGKGTIITRA